MTSFKDENEQNAPIRHAETTNLDHHSNIPQGDTNGVSNCDDSATHRPETEQNSRPRPWIIPGGVGPDDGSHPRALSWSPLLPLRTYLREENRSEQGAVGFSSRRASETTIQHHIFRTRSNAESVITPEGTNTIALSSSAESNWREMALQESIRSRRASAISIEEARRNSADHDSVLAGVGSSIDSHGPGSTVRAETQATTDSVPSESNGSGDRREP